MTKGAGPVFYTWSDKDGWCPHSHGTVDGALRCALGGIGRGRIRTIWAGPTCSEADEEAVVWANAQIWSAVFEERVNRWK